MISGMLWLDGDSHRSLDDKVQRAVDYYEEKYGSTARVCYVNKELAAEETQVGSVKVMPLATVMRHHFLVVAEQPPQH